MWLILILALSGEALALEKRDAEPTPVVNPNLAVLGSLGLFPGAASSSIIPPSFGAPHPRDICGNPDFLTNLLVYQYLSNSLPVGAPSPLESAKELAARHAVITATEYITSSTVITPTIVQTLPVHITITETSTKGLNGQFSLYDLTTGSTSVVPTPLSTAVINLDSDLTVDPGTRLNTLSTDPQMLKALTSLLERYLTNPDDSQGKKKPSKHPKVPFAAFHDSNLFDAHINDDDQPKFNVLKGFTLSDHEAPPSGGRKGGLGGTASTNTRYSKYLTQEKVDSNSLAKNPDSNRERERFSASTSLKTISTPAGVTPDNRLRPSIRNQRQFRPRHNRHISNNAKSILNRKPKTELFAESVITVYEPGTAPGHYRVAERTLHLRDLSTVRIRREASELIKPTATVGLEGSSTISPNNISKDIFKILKSQDKRTVKTMLKSLYKWIDFYSKELLSSDQINENTPYLTPSSPEIDSTEKGATTFLSSISSYVSSQPLPQQNTSKDTCSHPSTVTETVYRTVYIEL